MTWTSIEQIVRGLRLDSRFDDYDGLKRELRIKIAELHPDKKGGEFSSSEDEGRYNSALSAYEFVNLLCHESTALVSVTQLPAIIKAVRDAQLGSTQQQVGQLRAECREENRLDAHNRYALPRISSGVFAAVCASLFTFSGSLAEHPLLGILAKNMIFQISLLVLAFYAGIFFLLTWVQERKEDALADYLMSEKARRKIFDQVLHKTRVLSEDVSSQQFTIRDVMDVVDTQWTGHRHYKSSSIFKSVLFGNRGVKPSLIEKITLIHLLELEKRGAIHQIEAPSMDSIYEFDNNLKTSEQQSEIHIN